MPANELRRTPGAGRVEIDAVPPKPTRGCGMAGVSAKYVRAGKMAANDGLACQSRLESVCRQQGPRGRADAVPPRKMRFYPLFPSRIAEGAPWKWEAATEKKGEHRMPANELRRTLGERTSLWRWEGDERRRCPSCQSSLSLG
jgi:hypothetical protein